MKRLVLVGMLMALLLPASLLAQTATGVIVGTVVDQGGGALPGVTITLSNPSTGYTRVAVSNEAGYFRLNAVLAGTYVVKAELSGFATVATEGVVVNVASQRTLNVTLRQAQVAETLTVTADVPLVESTAAIGTVVSENQLENLPLNGRQFANLGVLAPGTALSYNNDPTKPGQLTIMLNGGSGRNINFVMDGGDNTDDTIGGALQNFNLEAVEEFKIQTMLYKAEYGRSSGGVLAVVTKSGTNTLHGSAYGYFRSDSWNSTSKSEELAGGDKSEYDRKQYGASLGGPIIKDKVHFFATYERTPKDTNYTVDSGGIYPDLDGKAFNLPSKDEMATAKVTYDISLEQFLQVRYGYQKNSEKYGQNSLAAPSNLGTTTNKYESVLAGHTAMLGSDMLNEFVFQYTKFKNNIAPDSLTPLLYYPSGFAIGTNINTPQSTNQTKYQYRDDFTFPMSIAGQDHTFKAGVMFIDEPTLGGDFSSGLTGQYSVLEDRQGAPITDITIYGGFSGDSTPTKQYSAYLQDDWRVSQKLTLNVGLRYDYYDALYLDQRTNPIWQALSTQTTYNESYLRDFQGGKGGIIRNSKNGWAPRLGFAWDFRGDGQMLLRGGWGRYYDFPYSNATVLFPAMAVQSNYGVAYNHYDETGIKNPDGTFWQIGQPLPPNQVTPGAFTPNEVASPTLKPPYSDQASLGFSWQATPWLGVTVEAVTAAYRNLPFRFRANPVDPATGERRFPEFASFRVWYGKGFADYDGFNLGFRARREKFELQGFYTLSKTTGNILAGADEFRITSVDYQPDLKAVRDQSINPYDPLCDACSGPLNTDSRHKLTLSGTYQLPWGFAVSGMYRYRSAPPYTKWTAKDDNNDGYVFELADGVKEVNSERGHDFSQFDLRLSKTFSFGGDLSLELVAEMFNVFNSTNPAGYVGRTDASNYGQPNFYAGDPLQGEQRLWQFGLRVAF